MNEPKLQYLIDLPSGNREWIDPDVIRDMPEASELIIHGTRHAWFCQCAQCGKGSAHVVVKW